MHGYIHTSPNLVHYYISSLSFKNDNKQPAKCHTGGVEFKKALRGMLRSYSCVEGMLTLLLDDVSLFPQ